MAICVISNEATFPLELDMLAKKSNWGRGRRVADSGGPTRPGQ